MSGRKIGGGRVLGNGRSLGPPATIPPSKASNSNSKLLSPTPSTASLESSASTSQTSAEAQDLTSRVVQHARTEEPDMAAAAASARLFCPICNDEMVTLLQLNRHLDDNHKDVEEVQQDEVKDWFQKQMIKAKKFQPLAVINQKLKGLDVFESNNSRPPTPPPPVAPRGIIAPAQAPTPTRSPEPARTQEPDEVITRTHWQRPGPNDVCSDPVCGKRLSGSNGKVNCRKCGKLFCEEHTMYQMKLSRSALHEPVRGVWCRVCETCYKSRDGYMDHTGLEVDHTRDFARFRSQVVDRAVLEASRLEKRLTRLTQLLANAPPAASTRASLLWPLSPSKDPRKEIEQSVVSWEDDASVLRCPFCQQDFSSYVFRRHHCRICGRVVCGDARTQCSTEVGLSVAAPSNTTEKSDGQVNVDVRMCRDCKHTIFSRKDFADTITHKPPDVRSYENLVQFERGIRHMLPQFQRLLSALQDPEKPPTPAQLTTASRTRKRLMDAFTQYDIAARRIRDMPTSYAAQEKLQKAIYTNATNFLHTHMLPLKSLPKVLRHATPNGHHGPSPLANGASPRPSPAGTPNGKSLASIRPSLRLDDSTSQLSGTSTTLSALEDEEKGLKERLIVLEEQRFFVGEMIAAANKRRKFDEVAALSANVRDLETEITGLQGRLEGVGREVKGVWEGRS